MTKIKEKTVAMNDWKRSTSLKAYCLLVLFILSFVITANISSVNAASNWQITALAPVEQTVTLTNPSSAVPGGRGFMTPQKVCVLNENGEPVINTPVTFEVSNNSYITSLMRGTYSRTITVNTDSNGIATAANTASGFLGEGFQVYSQYSYFKQTLQVTATVSGLAPVTFNVVVNTYDPSNPPPVQYTSNWQITALAPVEQTVTLSNPSSAVPGGRGFMTPQKVCVLNENGEPVINTPVTFEVASNSYITSLMRGTNSRTITVYTDSNGVATAANTATGFLGEGYQIYSQYSGINQTLQVIATVSGLAPVTFNVVVNTYDPSNPPPVQYTSDWQITALAPVEQTVTLSNPSSAASGGRGFMTPQRVCVLDENGEPVINTPVTFEVASNSYITSLMRGTYSRTITVYTDSNGVATAANTASGFLGEGFQVYSQYPYIKQTLQVTATVSGLAPVTFNTVVKTYGYQY